ncbi:hypothetical protein FHX81_0438 [Saccharothrix saharensis]|uniref:Uncharacterized protein n=1 Tax=Saccharothrix saharensis TaxID=571190 RepID=A0A543J5X4_9PSEU|nr:hypothetical protein FHX81_0438 [Saccharothrix saharensis]
MVEYNLHSEFSPPIEWAYASSLTEHRNDVSRASEIVRMRSPAGTHLTQALTTGRFTCSDIEDHPICVGHRCRMAAGDVVASFRL